MNSRTLTALLCTSLFPERNAGCGLRIFRNDSQLLSPADSDLRSRVARGLDCWDAITSLESFIGGGASTENVQILVCVTGIGDCVTGTVLACSVTRTRPPGLRAGGASHPPELSSCWLRLGVRYTNPAPPHGSALFVLALIPATPHCAGHSGSRRAHVQMDIRLQVWGHWCRGFRAVGVDRTDLDVLPAQEETVLEILFPSMAAD